jgi:hypothetical protein
MEVRRLRQHLRVQRLRIRLFRRRRKLLRSSIGTVPDSLVVGSCHPKTARICRFDPHRVGIGLHHGHTVALAPMVEEV